MAIGGFKAWRAMHYLSVIVVLGASLFAFKLSSDASMLGSKSYAVPLLGAIIVTALIAVLGKAKKA